MTIARYSVVIPTYNRASTLGRALASVTAQSFPAAEIVVVDDGSTDDTAAVLAEYAAWPLRHVVHPRNLGAAAARNSGVEAATSPWIAFLDSDDEWMPDKMDRQMAAVASSGPDVRAHVTGYLIIDTRNDRSRTFRPTRRDITRSAMLLGCPLCPGSTLVVSREAYLELGGLDTGLPRLEDWDWAIRYLDSHAFAVIAEPLAIVHKGSDPSYAHVKDSVERLRLVHRERLYDRSWIDGRKFDSTLLVEEAAGALYDGNNRKAVALTLKSLLMYPFRDLTFYATLAQRALRVPGRLFDARPASPPAGRREPR
ncbi:glycosyltransferase family 2 protein [Xanthobacteraceae bacterium Astr-EGSB]|uniref:glycosyltransferase family 2 protein n=1 Tax=Astrobacterium formosum TaxID=3069710 RepID=UPI0027B2C525|nr:glycosyltransferase family 2 protein [Xanthobacteraceae bacterium Astr-EGSB]